MERTLDWRSAWFLSFSSTVSLINSIQPNLNTSSNGKLTTPWANISTGQLCQLENPFSYSTKSALPVFRVQKNLKSHQLQCNHPPDEESEAREDKAIVPSTGHIPHQEQKWTSSPFPMLDNYENVWKHHGVPTPSMCSSHSCSYITLVSFLEVVLLFMFLFWPLGGPNVTWPAEVIKTRSWFGLMNFWSSYELDSIR